MSPASIARTLTLILVGATGQAATAQTAPQVHVTVDVREVVPDDVHDTPGAATTLSDDEIVRWRPFSLHDLLVHVPGAMAVDDDVLGRRSGIGVRGAPGRRSRKTLLLEDGTPINASTYLDPSTHYTPPLERLERVDVLRGTGHVLHGPLNNHGIVNFRNKQPTAAPQTVADVAFGTQGVQRRHILHRRTAGPIGVVAAYTGMKGDGAFEVERHAFDDFFGSITGRPGGLHEVQASATYFRERSHYDESNLTPQEFRTAPRDKREGQQYNRIAVDLIKVDLAHNTHVGPRLALSTKAFVTNLDRPRFAVDLGESPVDLLPRVVPASPFVEGVSGEMVGRLRHYRTTGVEHRADWQGPVLFGRAHRLQWGVRGERQALDDQRSRGGPGEVLEESRRGPLVRDIRYRASAASAFIQDVTRAGPVTVTAGVRVEHYTQHRRRLPSVDDGPTGRPPDADATTLLLPSVSAHVALGTGTSVFATVGRGYTPAFARTAAGFPLEPETGLNLQIGARSVAIPGIVVEGATFLNRVSQTVVQLPFTIGDQNIVVNSEDSRTSGLEGAVQVHSAAWTRSRTNAFVRMSGTFVRATFSGGDLIGREVPDVPRHASSVSAGVEHASGWHASLTRAAMGSFVTDLANTRELTLADEDGVPLHGGDTFDLRETVVLGEVPARALWSGRVQIPLRGDGLMLWVEGRNLTNRLYIVDLANGLRPGGRRTLTAGVRVVF